MGPSTYNLREMSFSSQVPSWDAFSAGGHPRSEVSSSNACNEVKNVGKYIAPWPKLDVSITL
jgi:hypothetical protein